MVHVAGGRSCYVHHGTPCVGYHNRHVGVNCDDALNECVLVTLPLMNNDAWNVWERTLLGVARSLGRFERSVGRQNPTQTSHGCVSTLNGNVTKSHGFFPDEWHVFGPILRYDPWCWYLWKTATRSKCG